MSDKIFIDTNIVVYLYSTDSLKRKKSHSLIESANTAIISTQVIIDNSLKIVNPYSI